MRGGTGRVREMRRRPSERPGPHPGERPRPGSGPGARRRRALSPAHVFALVAALTLAAAATPRPGAAQSDEEAIKAVLVDMWDAIEKGDLERYARHVHPDFTSFGETDRYMKEGRELELRGVASWIERVKGVHTEMHHPLVTVRGDTAWITYYWTDEGTTLAGERVTSEGKSTRIFVREGGRWLCIHGHYTLAP